MANCWPLIKFTVQIESVLEAMGGNGLVYIVPTELEGLLSMLIKIPIVNQ